MTGALSGLLTFIGWTVIAGWVLGLLAAIAVGIVVVVLLVEAQRFHRRAAR